MSEPAGQSESRELEGRLGNLLRAGVTLAAGVVLIGAVVYIARHGQEQPSYHTFRGEPSDLRTFEGILNGCWGLRGRSIIQLGLLMLIATPISRVVFAAYGFARQRDWMYVGISSIVLTLLLYGLLTSK